MSFSFFKTRPKTPQEVVRSIKESLNALYTKTVVELKPSRSYDNREIALTCEPILRECAKFPTLARYILEPPSFVLFFKFVELPTFDVASDAKYFYTSRGKYVKEIISFCGKTLFNVLLRSK